jgi:hypothetical protein
VSEPQEARAKEIAAAAPAGLHPYDEPARPAVEAQAHEERGRPRRLHEHVVVAAGRLDRQLDPADRSTLRIRACGDHVDRSAALSRGVPPTVSIVSVWPGRPVGRATRVRTPVLPSPGGRPAPVGEPDAGHRSTASSRQPGRDVPLHDVVVVGDRSRTVRPAYATVTRAVVPCRPHAGRAGSVSG